MGWNGVLTSRAGLRKRGERELAKPREARTRGGARPDGKRNLRSAPSRARRGVPKGERVARRSGNRRRKQSAENANKAIAVTPQTENFVKRNHQLVK